MPNDTVPAAATGLPEDRRTDDVGDRAETALLATRRELRRIAEAALDLLDELDAPTEDLEDVGDDEPSLGWRETHDDPGRAVFNGAADDREADLDFETTDEDDEDGGDHEPNFGWTVDGCTLGADGDREPSLGSTVDGDTSGLDADDDLTTPETSAGLPKVTIAETDRAAAKARFDPRLGLRPEPGFSVSGNPLFRTYAPPRFPHEAANRRPFDEMADIAALERELGVIVLRARRRKRGSADRRR